jgi:hypothetical protein
MMRALGGYQRLDVRQRRRFSDALMQIDNRIPADNGDAARDMLNEKSALGLDQLAYFQISSPPPPGDSVPDRGLPADVLSNIRTDLDGFGDIEVDALIGRGWDVADRYVRAYITPQPAAEELVASAPFTLAKDGTERKRQMNVLRAGQFRFFRALKVHAPLSMAVTGIIAAAVLWAGFSGVSISEALRAAWSVVLSIGRTGANVLNSIPVIGPALHTAFTFVPERAAALVRWLLHTDWLLGVVVGLVAVRWLATTLAQRVRPLRTTWKWLVGLRGNLLWFAWAAPFWMALTSAAVAGLGILFFYLPWFRRARLK